MDESWYDEFGNYIGPEFKSDAEDEDALSDHNQVVLAEDNLVRIVALVGHIHHGKTVFMDGVIEQMAYRSTFDEKSEKHTRYTDTSFDDLERRICTPMTVVLEDSNSKSYICHILDTPGHFNSPDVMTEALRLADGAVLIVDAAEGVMVNTEMAIRHALQERLPIVVVINKVDRLITELRLPPKDAYHKLRHIIEAINTHISTFSSTYSSTARNVQLIDPTVGNVCFASAIAGWSFTLLSFAKLYVKLHVIPFDANKFASRLWGDYYFDPDTRGFKKKQPSSGVERSFVQFVLEPLYKIYSQAIGEHQKSMEATPAELGVTLSNAVAAMPMLRFVCRSLFGSATGFADMLVRHIPTAKADASNKVDHIYTGLKRDRDEDKVDVPRKFRFETTCVDLHNRELIAIRKREAEDFRRGFKYDPSREAISLAWPHSVISWTAESSGIVWVAMHGLDSICVVTRTGDLDVTRVLGSLRHHTKESVLREFRKTVISEVEDYASADSILIEYINRMLPKPFGVVSVILGSDQVHNESGLEVSSTKYDVTAATMFLKEKMEGSTVNETIKTAISAFKILFREEFKAEEIEVSVLDPDGCVRHLGMSDIEGYLAAVNKPPVSPSSSIEGSGGLTIDEESQIDSELLGTSSDLGLEISSEVEMLSEELEMLSEEPEMFE